jgi:predicted RNA-binding Zn ribbon-like protein
MKAATKQPDLAKAVFEIAIALRETIYQIFSAVAENREVAKRDLDALNAALQEALPWQQVAFTTNSFSWTWTDSGDHLDCILGV